MYQDSVVEPSILISRHFGARHRNRYRFALALLFATCGYLVLASIPARADEDLGLERSVAQFMIIDNEKRALENGSAPNIDHPGMARPGDPEPPEEVNTSHNVAVLPQIGYDPEAGFIVGAKFSDINFGASHLNLDVGATQSTEGETDVDVTLGTPHLLGSDFIGLVRAQYELHPTQDFYGLGNNGAGDDALSQHEYHATSLSFTLARRLAPHWVLAGTLGYNRTTIGPGDPDSDHVSTGDKFSHLPGLEGGYNNPISLALIYNTQRDLTRPEQGWNVIGKVTRVGPELGNDFNYTRFLADASYVHPIFSPKHLIGVRMGGEYVTGDGDDLPFYEFASVGGIDSLAGFYPNRFLGQSRIFVRTGYQTMLADFDFRNIWRVRLDGTVFAGVGRVFLDRSRLPDDLLSDTPDVAPDLSNKLRYSYGAGLHIALGEALSARLDAGFSEESKGLVYLTFGTAF